MVNCVVCGAKDSEVWVQVPGAPATSLRCWECASQAVLRGGVFTVRERAAAGRPVIRPEQPTENLIAAHAGGDGPKPLEQN